MNAKTRNRNLALVCVAWLLLASGATHATEIPAQLRDFILYAGQRKTGALALDGRAFLSVTRGSEVPFLLWPGDPIAAAPFEREPAAVAAWLARHAEVLGHRDFELRFSHPFSFREAEAWEFSFVRKGIALHKSKLLVLWVGAQFLGVVNDFPQRIRSIEESSTPPAPGQEFAYFPQRQAGLTDLVLASVTHEEDEEWSTTIFSPPGAPPSITKSSRLPKGPFRPAKKFQEYNVPTGTFPDQIGIDHSLRPWFSQPSNDVITHFDLLTKTFTTVSTGSGTGPDGLFVDSKDRVWTGLYNSGELGWWDPGTASFTRIAAPYTPANLAIPVEHSGGSIWVTDHANNKISEFDPITQTWLLTLKMPTASCWVVQGAEDVVTGGIWFTEYAVDQLGALNPSRNLRDVGVPGGGPAFCAVVNHKVYYSEWNDDLLGELDILSGVITEYQYPVVNEIGGPLWPMPDGRIVVGTRNKGYIMVFDPMSKSFDAFNIPGNAQGLKDGLVVDRNGAIWFTESGRNKIARLVIE